MNTNGSKIIKTRIQVSIVTLIALLATSATAQVNYAVSSTYAYVTSSPNASGDIVIASSYNGLPVTRISDAAFLSCHDLTGVTIPNSVVSIGVQAFYACTNLTRASIPNSVTSIGFWPFVRCTSLTNISVDAANSSYSSLDGGLFNKAQTILIQFPDGRGGGYAIPSSVTNIAERAFFYGTSLTDVTIPNGVTTIGSSAFSFCDRLTNITVGSANPSFSSLDGVLFNKAQTSLIQFPVGRSGIYVVPGSVTTLQAGAFSDCTGLTNLTFLGNAPTLNGTVFYNVGPSTTVYYYYGTTGWGQTYGGLPTRMLGAPAPQIGTGSTGVKPGGYGFTIDGVTGQTIVVEASTNLANWQPIWTNTLSDVSTNFVDPQWLNIPHRFYRLGSY